MQSGSLSRPATWGPRPNRDPTLPSSGTIQQQAFLQGMSYQDHIAAAPLLDSADLLKRKRLVMSLQTCLMMVIFLPFTIIVISMCGNVDVFYFCGHWILTTLIVPVALITFAIVAFLKTVPKNAFLLIVVVPCVFLAVFFFLYGNHLAYAKLTMKEDDCANVKARQDLQLAYSTGLTILKKCYLENGNVLPQRIEDCPAWDLGTQDLLPEFLYLAHLEHSVGCSGICEGDVRLFRAVGSQSIPCNHFIEENIRIAGLQSETLMWYSLFLLALSFPCYFAMAPLLDQYYVSIPSPKAMQALPVQQTAVWAAPAVPPGR